MSTFSNLFEIIVRFSEIESSWCQIFKFSHLLVGNNESTTKLKPQIAVTPLPNISNTH